MNTTEMMRIIQENAARAEMRRDRYMAMDSDIYNTVETYWSGYLDACIDLLAILKKQGGMMLRMEDET